MTGSAILLVGAGGHARACIDVIEQEGSFTVVGLVGQSAEVGSQVLGYMVLGTDAELPGLAGKYSHTLIAIGQIKTPEPRVRLFEVLERAGFAFPAIVSPRAYVSPHASIGPGTIVMHGAVVNAGAIVGRNCIINSLSLVEHDAVISDHCHIATGAAINSGVRVGVGTFIGSNASVRQGIRIGHGCVVGMGQRVLTDCASGGRLPAARKPA
mgnify:CR=1 FL=1